LLKISELEWSEEKQINKAAPGDSAFKRRRLNNFYLTKVKINWIEFEQYCKNHLFDCEQIDYKTLVRILDIRFIFCTQGILTDENIKFIIEVNSNFRFKTDPYFEALIALTAFLYESQTITYALVRCISKNSDDTIKKKMRPYFT
jgi:hypothetical protein